MRIFVTGAAGYVGSAVVQELKGAGHGVLGLARNDANAQALTAAGAEVHRGDLTDPASLVAGAQACDGVVNCAFIHDFSKMAESSEIERVAVAAMLDALAGSNKPFVLTSGVAMISPGRLATEDDMAPSMTRGVTAEMVREAATRGVRTCVIRLPPTTHGAGDRGFTPTLMDVARAKGVAGYVGDGANRWAGGRRADAAVLYRLALEKGEAGANYHAVGDEGVPTRDIAAAIGKAVGVPVKSIAPEDAGEHFGWIGMFFGMDMAASSQLTQQRLGWRPTPPGLLDDITGPNYANAVSKYA
jgi:nucleoside-diphosphate-sugar epimerase